jgi:hypothetical protein
MHWRRCRNKPWPDGEVRPIKALQALGDEMGTRIGPQLARLKQAGAAPR